MSDALREIRLYGALGRKFGRVHRLAVGSVREALEALAVLLPGWRTYMREHSMPGYHLCVGRVAPGHDLGIDELDRPVGTMEPILVVPAVVGSKRAGVLQTVVGAVIAVVGAYFGQAWLVQIGVSMALGGVLQILSGPRKADGRSAENQTSWLFGSSVNTDEEGLPVPVAIGRVLAGGARISAGISTDEVPVAQTQTAGGSGSGIGALQEVLLPGFQVRKLF